MISILPLDYVFLNAAIDNLVLMIIIQIFLVAIQRTHKYRSVCLDGYSHISS